ncbi:MAG: hypothetical protein CMA10_04835 [Euryarchaeota archaeon]|nr:hypothetical protein [Euryarchaeota archaeon]
MNFESAPVKWDRNVDPKIWGAGTWKLLHALAWAYPECPTTADERRVTDFMYSLVHALPCFKCRKHLHELLNKNPPAGVKVQSRSAFREYMVELHNEVNKLVGNSQLAMDEALAIHGYSHHGEISSDQSARNGYVHAATTLAAIIVVAGCIALLISPSITPEVRGSRKKLWRESVHLGY